MTTFPPDFTGTTLPGTKVKTNDWYTTTDDGGKSTLVPLIVGGVGCEPGHTRTTTSNGKNVMMLWDWNSDQTGCEKRTDDKYDSKDCKNWFMTAIDKCDECLAIEKWGSKMVYTGKKGCVYVEIYGEKVY